MRNLKIILGITYPILIILLILLNLRSCRQEDSQPIGEPPTVLPGDTTTTPEGQIADSTTIRQASEIGGMGDLKVTLLWDFYADIDLYVKQPTGTTIWYRNKRDSFTGGFLDVDNIKGGVGSAENIYWEHPRKGQYTVEIEYYGKSTLSDVVVSGICTVVVMQRGEQVRKFEIPMSRVKQRETVVKLTI